MSGGPYLTVNALLGLLLASRGPAYTLVRLLQGMDGPGLRTRLFAPLDRWRGDPIGIPSVTGGFSRAIDAHLPYRLLSPALMKRAERRMIQSLRGGENDVVFTWGEVSLDLSRLLRDRGVRVVREKFNCTKRSAKAILDKAYGEIGGGLTHHITDALIEKEEEELRLAEAVFCPSPMVRRSLLDIGLPAERLLSTSYGWEPSRFSGEDRALEPVSGPTILFVGFVCVRKGAHILLEAWRRANISGRLVLVGDMEPLIAARYKDVLARRDVVYVPYTDNIGAYFRSADWFIFPSLEEGGPQVTYEAAGAGLPVVVSPMGAGAFARHGLDGIVVDSDEPAEWADVIGSLPDRQQQRLEFASYARKRSEEFTYGNVGAKRRKLLLDRFGSAGSSPQALAAIA